MNNSNLPLDGSFDPSAIQRCFISTVKQTLDNCDVQGAALIRKELIRIVGDYTAPYLFSPDLIAEVTASVFQNEVFRDWIMNTRFVFFMNMEASFGKSMVGFMVDSLARSASVDLGAMEILNEEDQALFEDAQQMPKQMIDEMLTYRGLRVALAANTWLVVILLAIAFINLEHDVLKTPGSKEPMGKGKTSTEARPT